MGRWICRLSCWECVSEERGQTVWSRTMTMSLTWEYRCRRRAARCRSFGQRRVGFPHIWKLGDQRSEHQLATAVQDPVRLTSEEHPSQVDLRPLTCRTALRWSGHLVLSSIRLGPYFLCFLKKTRNLNPCSLQGLTRRRADRGSLAAQALSLFGVALHQPFVH